MKKCICFLFLFEFECFDMHLLISNLDYSGYGDYYGGYGSFGGDYYGGGYGYEGYYDNYPGPPMRGSPALSRGGRGKLIVGNN